MRGHETQDRHASHDGSAYVLKQPPQDRPEDLEATRRHPSVGGGGKGPKQSTRGIVKNDLF